jgi:hypothetical protein
METPEPQQVEASMETPEPQQEEAPVETPESAQEPSPEENPEVALEQPEDEPTVEGQDESRDEFADMDRKMLKMFIKEMGLDVKVFKSNSDEDIRGKIRSAMALGPH